MADLIFFAVLIYLFLFFYISAKASECLNFCFNPKRNYEFWYKLNWFGVLFFTILYWIVFLPFGIMAIIYWAFTTGRK